MDEKKYIGKYFWDTLFKVIYHQLWKIQQIDTSNATLFHIKVFGKNIKQTKPTSYFARATARLSVYAIMRLRIIKQINKAHKNIEMENMLHRFSCISFLLNFLGLENIFSVAGTISNQVSTFTIADTKRYVPVVSLTKQDNEKLLEQLAKAFKRTINWNNINLK